VVEEDGERSITLRPKAAGWRLHALLPPFDWTKDWLAVTNAEILEIWDTVPNNMPIDINP
jgi:hypothetical protein